MSLQKAVFFTDGQSYVMNYGVSHAAPPLTDQAYIYTGYSNPTWMGYLAGVYPKLKIRDLVLPGAHDAGMYMMSDVGDIAAAVEKMCSTHEVIKFICKTATEHMGQQLLENMSITQKDTAMDQLRFGTRFFDFRPAYNSSKTAVYHVNNFIPGVQFKDFLTDIDGFLKSNPSEIVFVQITSSGIDTDQFKPLSQSETEQFLSKYISKDVGYNLTTSIGSYNDKLLTDVVHGGKRLIVIFGKDNVKDSYSDGPYSASLTDPQSVINALTSTLQTGGSYQYTVLQLQNTGSAALGKGCN